jgi:ribose 5-phosphate isomerase B
MKLAIGSDNFGFALKVRVTAHLAETGHEVVDFGCPDESPVDYPDVALEVAEAVAGGRFARAILICGTGLGMAIVANKVPGVRAAAVSDPYSAERAVKSNDAQILCLGGLVVGAEVAPLLVDHWLSSSFAGGRSTAKVEKIKAIDDRYRRSRVPADAGPS